MIDLRSDTVSKPTEEMIASIKDVALGDDVMGEDPTVKELEELGAGIFGKEAGLLTSSGTMANQIAVMVYTNRGEEVIVGEESHIYNLEVSGLSTLSQVQARPISAPKGCFNPIEVEKSILTQGIQKSDTGLICIENTYNLNKGYIMPLENIREISEIGKQYNIPVYMDGARVLNAAIASSIDIKVIVEPVDSLQLCLTKGLSAPVGSLLLGTKEFIEKAKRIRQRLGGGMRQAGIIAAPAIIALKEMVSQLELDHKNAKKLAKGLWNINPSLLKLEEVETNIVSIETSLFKLEDNDLLKFLKQNDVKIKKIAENKFRMVTHRQISGESVKKVIHIFNKVLNS